MLPGGPGHSHQSVRDISALGGVPGLDLIEPSCEREVALALDYAVNGTSTSTYLRLVSIPCEVPYELPADYALSPGRGVVVRGGSDAIVISYGPVLLAQACLAADIIGNKDGVDVQVVNLPWLNRVDRDWLRTVTDGFAHVFTLDNHYLSGGQGELLSSVFAESGLSTCARIIRFGLSDFPACGTNDEVLRHHGLDAGSLAECIGRTLAGG